MKKLFVIFLLTLSAYGVAQQQLHYSFAESPQTLMVNPGAETNFKMHIGVPALSGISAQVGTTGFVLEDLFGTNSNSTYTERFENVISKLTPSDYIAANVRIDVLNFGYRLDHENYLSFGFYEEADFIGYFPRDIVDLMYYGNQPYPNRQFTVSEFVGKADLYGVLHVGISRKVNEKFNFGARLKIYSASLNVQTNHNSGVIVTYPNSQNLIRQSIINLDFNLRSSGLINSEDQILERPEDLYKRTFLSGDLGVGFDVGLTYHFTPQLEFTGSILDIGFIKHKTDVRQFLASGDYTFDGIDLQFDPNNPIDYWNQLDEAFHDNIYYDNIDKSYTTWRPAKVNAAIKYSFGEIRHVDCYATTRKIYYRTAVGAQFHSIFRPLKPQFAFTGFFEASPFRGFHTKFTYTINEFSSQIVGVGASINLGPVNIFGFADNLFELSNLETSNTASLNLGVNIIIK